MARTIDSIVASHRAAQERRDQGRPIWDRKIRLGDVFRNEDMTFEQSRDAIVDRIRRTGGADDNYTVGELLDELADTDDGDAFDEVWDLIYDEADADRVWIDTIKS